METTVIYSSMVSNPTLMLLSFSSSWQFFFSCCSMFAASTTSSRAFSYRSRAVFNDCGTRMPNQLIGSTWSDALSTAWVSNSNSAESRSVWSLVRVFKALNSRASSDSAGSWEADTAFVPCAYLWTADSDFLFQSNAISLFTLFSQSAERLRLSPSRY